MKFDFDFKRIQKKIGYKFSNKDLLFQAFIRRSFSNEHDCENNEVLEFIGDKALDLAVIRIMIEKYGKISEGSISKEFKLSDCNFFKSKYDEGKFTDIKKDLVEGQSLAKSMDSLGLMDEVIMGRGEEKQKARDEGSVKEQVFEAILGAVALDCNWDMDQITEVAKNMIDFEDYFENKEKDMIGYVGKLEEWSRRNGNGVPEYKYSPFTDDDEKLYQCDIKIQGVEEICLGVGYDKLEAKREGAKEFYLSLIQCGVITNKYIDAVGDVDADRSIAQINELVQKGMLKKPDYEYIQGNDEDDENIWICTMHLHDLKKSITCKGKTKTEAKKCCTYMVLLYLMDEYDKELDVDE